MKNNSNDSNAKMENHAVDILIGRNIREKRIEVGVTQAALANHLGISKNQVHKYENGSNRLSISMLVRAARLIGTSVASLVGEAPREGKGALDLERALEIEDAAELMALYKKLSNRNRLALRIFVAALAG